MKIWRQKYVGVICLSASEFQQKPEAAAAKKLRYHFLTALFTFHLAFVINTSGGWAQSSRQMTNRQIRTRLRTTCQITTRLQTTRLRTTRQRTTHQRTTHSRTTCQKTPHQRTNLQMTTCQWQLAKRHCVKKQVDKSVNFPFYPVKKHFSE